MILFCSLEIMIRQFLFFGDYDKKLNESNVAIFLPRHTRSSEHNSLYVVSMLGSGIMVVAVIGFILRYPPSLDEDFQKV